MTKAIDSGTNSIGKELFDTSMEQHALENHTLENVNNCWNTNIYT
jgi:hypothetical protein